MAAPFTPMDSYGNINTQQIEEYSILLLKNGVKGAFICGSTGEGVSLTFNEKKRIFKEWGKYTSENLTTIAMVGGNSIFESKELAAYAKDCNISGIAMLPPFYFKPVNASHLAEICYEVSSVVPDIPAYYYHIPALTGVNIPMIEFLKVADKSITNLCGIKYTHSDLKDSKECINFENGKYNILWGRDETLFTGLQQGIKGAVGSTYNYFAPLYIKIIEYFNNKEFEKTKELQKKSVEFCDFLGKYGGIGTGKAYMRLIGFDCGEFRSPIKNLSTRQIQELKSDLDQSGFFDYCSKV